MTAKDMVIEFLDERGPASTSEIAQALSEAYGYGTVKDAVRILKKKGSVVDTGERYQGSAGRPEHIVALKRELERARSKTKAERVYYAANRGGNHRTE